MPPKGHAILSASSSDRWLHCPPSARLCETYEDKGSDYAAEGTDAHELCEYKLKRALGMDASDPTENLTWYNEELYRWADEVLKPTADLAFAGDGNFLCGEWCGFCKAKHECRARAEANLTLAQYDFKLPPLLEDSEIQYILSRADELVAWASDIKEYALQQAISGKEWAGWKLVEGRSNRKYSNEEAVIQAVTDAGFDPYEKKLLGITAMQKRLGKSRFDELLTAYIEKPQGKPTLVPESDKRPAMNNAKTDFMEEN